MDTKLNKNLPKSFGVKFDFSKKKGKPRFFEEQKQIQFDTEQVSSAAKIIDKAHSKDHNFHFTQSESKKVLAKSMSSGMIPHIEDESWIHLEVKKENKK